MQKPTGPQKVQLAAHVIASTKSIDRAYRGEVSHFMYERIAKGARELHLPVPPPPASSSPPSPTSSGSATSS